MKDLTNVGIIGTGILGSELYDYFVEAEYFVVAYDSDPNKGHQDSLASAEVVFICVPTLPADDGAYDLSMMDSAFERIVKDRGEYTPTIVVIKSTVIPGTTLAYQNKYPMWVVLFSPEFLTERYARRDTREPARQIVGCSDNPLHCEAAQKVMSILPTPNVGTIVASTESAEAVKLFANAFYALKVSYANQFYDYCQNNKIEYDSVKMLTEGDPMMAQFHLDVKQDGYRGFGGKCLPKDTAALLTASEGSITLLAEAIKYNDELKGKACQ